ncbi:MAG TPA: sigma-70 family RNA polymerase sigma factor [Candidatus Limnocylindrales bacterium]
MDSRGTSLLARAAIGVLTDDDIAELLVSKSSDAYRLATWILRDAVAAEDAVQEAAMAAWNGRKKMRHADNPTAWFTTIVVNVCRDELRRRKRATLAETRVQTPGEEQDQVAARDEVGRAIDRLSTDEQMILALRFGRDLTVPQIAAQLRLAEGTVKSRLHHTLEHFRSALAAERRVEESGR